MDQIKEEAKIPLNKRLSQKSFSNRDTVVNSNQINQQQQKRQQANQVVGFYGGALYQGIGGTALRRLVASNDPFGFTKDDIQPTRAMIQYVAPKVGYRQQAIGAVFNGLKSWQDVDDKIKVINTNYQYQKLKGQAGFWDGFMSDIGSMATGFQVLSLGLPGGIAVQAASGAALGAISSAATQDIVGIKTDPVTSAIGGGVFGAAGPALGKWIGDTVARSRVVEYSRKNNTPIKKEFLQGRWGSQTVAQAIDNVRQAIEDKLPTVTVQGALKNPVTAKMKQFIGKTYRSQAGIQKVLNPDGTYTYIQVGSKGKTAEQQLRDYNQQLWRVKNQISDNIQQLKASGWSQGQIKQAVYQYAQNGTITSSTSEVGKQQIGNIATIARGLFDSRWTELNKRGLIESKLDKYFPVMIDNNRRMAFINSFSGTLQQKQQQAVQKLADNFYRSVDTPQQVQKFRDIFQQEVLRPIVQANNQKIDKALARAQKSTTRKKEDLQKKQSRIQSRLDKKDQSNFKKSQRQIKSSQKDLQKTKKASQQQLTKQITSLQKQEASQGSRLVNQFQTLDKQAIRQSQQMKANSRSKIASLQESAQNQKAELRKIWARNQQKTNAQTKAQRQSAATRRQSLKDRKAAALQKANKKKKPQSRDAAIKAAQNKYNQQSKVLQKKLKQQRQYIKQRAQKRAQALRQKQQRINDTLNRQALRQKGQLQKRLKKHYDSIQVRRNKLQQRSNKVLSRIQSRKSIVRQAHTARVSRATTLHKNRVQSINTKNSTRIDKTQQTKDQRKQRAIQQLRQLDADLATKVQRTLEDHPDPSQEQLQQLFRQWLKKQARNTALGWIDAGQGMKRGLLQSHNPSTKFTKRRMPFRYNLRDTDGFTPNSLRSDIDYTVQSYSRRSAGDLIIHDTYGYNSYDEASTGLRDIALQQTRSRSTKKGSQDRQKAMNYLLNRLYGRGTYDTHRELTMLDAISQILRALTFGFSNGFMAALNYTQIAQGVKAYGASFVLQSIPMVGQLFAKWSKGNLDIGDRKIIQSILFGQELKQLQLFSDFRSLAKRRYGNSGQGLTKEQQLLANIVAGVNYGVSRLPTTRLLNASQTSIVSTVQGKMLDDLIRLAYGDPAKGKQFFSKKALQRLSIDDAQMDQLMEYLRNCFTYTKDGAKLKGQAQEILNSNPNALNTLRRLGDYCADQVILRPSLADSFFKWDSQSRPLFNLLAQFKSFAIKSYQKRLVKATHRAAQGQQWSQACSLSISVALATIGNFGFTTLRSVGMDEEKKENYWRQSFGVGSLQELIDSPYKILNVMAVNSLRSSYLASVALALNTAGIGSQAKTTSSTDLQRESNNDQPLTINNFAYNSLAGSVADMLPAYRMVYNLGNLGASATNSVLLASQGVQWDSPEAQKNRQKLSKYFGNLLPNWAPFRQTIKQSLKPDTNYVK